MEKFTGAGSINPAEDFSDPLTELLRKGARELLAKAVEAELAVFLEGLLCQIKCIAQEFVVQISLRFAFGDVCRDTEASLCRCAGVFCQGGTP